MDCAVMDLETTALDAVGGGFLLCAVIKPLRGQPIVFRYDDLHCRPGNEKRLVSATIEALSKYDMWIGHNIERFDFAFLKSRAAILNIPFNVQPLMYDTMLAFKRVGYRTALNPMTGKPRAGLDHAVDFFGIPQKKTKVGYPQAHWRTVWATGKEKKDAMDQLVEHCVFDVEMTEELYWKILKVDPVWGIRRKK